MQKVSGTNKEEKERVSVANDMLQELVKNPRKHVFPSLNAFGFDNIYV